MKIYSKIIFLLSLTSPSSAFSQQYDSRGPIASDQFKVNRTKNGIFATDFSYKPITHSQITSKWIWIDPEKYPDQQATKAHWAGKRKDGALYVVNFKKTINIGDDVDATDIKLSADIQYRLFINGKLTQRGPANIGSDYNDFVAPKHWFYDNFTSKHSFKKGLNVITLEVSTLTKTHSSTTSGHGGLIMEADIHLKSGKHITVKTDTSWLCKPSKVYLANSDIDASAEATDWITSFRNDNTWSHAIVLSEKISDKWKLEQSELPQMMETRIYPTKVNMIKASGDTVTSSFPIRAGLLNPTQRFRLEFDNLYTGYLGLSLNGKQGTKIKLSTKEVPNGNNTQEMTYILADGLQTYEFPNLIDGKYIDVEVMQPTADLVINDIVINYSSYPVTYTGNFSCSDSSLNAIWKNIRWVTQMNMQTYHMDSPLHQEPVSDSGDYLIESMVNYYAFSSPLLVRQDLRKISLVLDKTGYKMFHTSYMLLWEQMLLNYYDYTGDKELLMELSPTVYKLLDQFRTYKGSTGIITEAPNYMFMDWGSVNKIGLHHPPASWGEGYMTAFYYKALTDGIKMADYLNDKSHSATLKLEADRLKVDFNTQLYDHQTQLYQNGLDGETKVIPGKWLPKDNSITTKLPYVNTLAVAYGLVSADKTHDIMKYVLTQKNVIVSPYFMYFVFDALAASNTFNEFGVDQMRRWDRLSGYPVGLKEGWSMGDYSHAWGGSPGYELPARILGISPGKPGFTEITIKPTAGDLRWAKGTVMTPQGKVSVDWDNSSVNFKINSVTPKVPVKFILSVDETDIITVNGKKIINPKTRFATKDITILRTENKAVEIELMGGDIEIIVTKN